jgi:hypothetical protein
MHIGTFLLKRGVRGSPYGSALELSHDIRDIRFRALYESIGSRKGLLADAESIIAAIASAKKDWRRFSDDIVRFSKDLFWFARGAFYLCLLPVARRACPFRREVPRLFGCLIRRQDNSELSFPHGAAPRA